MKPWFNYDHSRVWRAIVHAEALAIEHDADPRWAEWRRRPHPGNPPKHLVRILLMARALRYEAGLGNTTHIANIIYWALGYLKVKRAGDRTTPESIRVTLEQRKRGSKKFEEIAARLKKQKRHAMYSA